MNSINTLKALSVVTNVDTGHMIKKLQLENEELKAKIVELNLKIFDDDDYEDYLWTRLRVSDAFISTLDEIDLENWETFQDNFFSIILDDSGDDSTGEYELNLIEIEDD